MSNYNNLKSSINNNIYENQTQQITGTVLNAILNEMTNALGAGYQFAGVATVGMTPSEPDARIFYLAGEGIYTSFDGIQVPAGKLGILKWDNRWHLETIDGLGSGGANLTGYVTVASTDDLPDEGVATLGYLCGENLYLYVGEGGDTKEGKYQNCGSFRGPQGDSVQDVEQTQTSLENGGVNKIKFTLSNGISCEFQVRNGTTSSGLFPTLEALQAAYPSPVVGQYAFVGAGFPADIYVCTTAGTWTDSGEDYDGDNVDLTDYATKAEVNQLEAKVTDLTRKSRDENKALLDNGNYMNSNGSTTDTFDVVPGNTYLITGRVGGYANLCLAAFWDASGNFITGSAKYPTTGTGTPYSNVSVTAPANAATMKVCGNLLEAYPNPPSAKVGARNGVYQITDNLEARQEELLYYSLNKYFTGAGTTYAGIRNLGLAGGRRYRLVLANPNYDKTGTPSSTQYLFQISSANANGVVTTLVSVPSGTPVEQSYTFVVPADNVRVGVGGYAAVGEKVEFNIYDITDEDERFKDVNIASELQQGNSSTKGVISVDTFYDNRVSCILQVGEFLASGARLSAMVDDDKIIRNAALYNSNTDQTSGWLFYSGNSTSYIDLFLPSGSDKYDTIILTVAYKDLTTNIAPTDVSALCVGGYLASIIAIHGTEAENQFQGKTYSVMGDSIGTDDDGDTPAFTITANDVGKSLTSWITWFDYNNSTSDTASGTTKKIGGVSITSAMIGTQQTFTPSNSDIGKTIGTPRWAYNQRYSTKPWWKILGEKLGMTLNSSASWNGNSYCSHEESDNLRKIGYGWHPLQIERLANRDASGNRVAPDYIFLCRGANDATHTPYAKITDFGEGIDTIPADDSVADGYGFKEALAKTISAIQTTYPEAKIFVCTLTPLRRLNDDTFPMDNGTATMQAYNKAVKEVAEYMGVKVIDFSKCWTFYNCVSGGYVNSSDYTHPVQKGHNAMAEQAVIDIMK